MKRRAFLGAAAASVALPALAGCGGATRDSVRVLIGSNAQYPTQLRQWTSDVATEFRAMTGADVRFEQYSNAADEQRIIQLSVVSGNGPDVYALGTTFAPVAAATGGFLTMDTNRWDQVGGRDKFVPATLAMSGATRSSEVAIPLESRPFLMAYNTAMFDQAGIEVPKTWDALVAAAKRLTRGDRYGIALAYGDSYDPWKFVWTFASQYGNPLVSDGRALLTEPEVARAYRAYFGFLTQDKIVDPASVGWQSAQSIAAFAAGKAAMLLMTTPTVQPSLLASSVKDDWAFAPMPTVPPGESSLPSGGVAAGSIVSGDNMVVAGYSAHQELALAFIELVTGDEQQLTRNRLFGGLPVTTSASRTLAQRNTKLAPVNEAAAASKPTPFTGAWSDIQLALGNVVVQSRPALQRGQIDGAALTQLIAEAQQTAQSALDREAQAAKR